MDLDDEELEATRILTGATRKTTFKDMINTIILGDSYKLIKDIPDKSIDCIYIDVPYLMPNTKGESGGFMAKRVNKIINQDLKNIKSGFNLSILNEIVRINKTLNIFIWCNKFLIKDILDYFIDIVKCKKYEIMVWCKNNPIPMTQNVWLSDIEYCLWFGETGVKLNDGYELKSKWYESPINKKDKDKYKHPTIKPLELVKRHILHATQENDLVLDCFSGSGTTCVAAKELNRRFIGIEIDPEYHKISLDRLNGILANGQITFDTDISKI